MLPGPLCRELRTQIHIQVTDLRSLTSIANRRPCLWTAVAGNSANVDDLTTYLSQSLIYQYHGMDDLETFSG